MSNKLVSVVIPTHNRKDLVGRAIKSIQEQTYTNVEIIVVSDGSTDGTAKTVEAIANADSRISFFEYPIPKGANYARNFGAQRAKGEYLAFLDDDDAWQEHKLKQQMQVFETDDAIGLVTTGFHFIYVFNSSEATYVPTPPYDSQKAILLKNVIGGTPAVIMKKEVFEKAGGFDENLQALQDYDLWIRAAQVTKIGVYSLPSVDVYDYSDPNKISNNTYRYIDAYNRIESKYNELIKSLSKKDNCLRKYNFSMLLAKKGLRNGEKKIVRKYANIALKNKLSLSAASLFLLSLLPYSIVLKIKNMIRK